MNSNKTIRHQQVAKSIMSDIKSGRFAVNSALPGENVLAQEYGVSRSTLRTALARLEDLGLLERRQGARTRVLAREPAPVYVHSMHASDDLLQFAGPSKREVLSAQEIVADETLAPRLDDRPGRRWLHIGQARHLENCPLPICWTDVYLATAYADLLDEIKTYPGLIYTLIERDYDVTISEIVQRIKAVDIPDHLKPRFGEDIGRRALELTRRYKNSSGGCEMVTISVLPDKHYTYEITLTR